ncbi:MAG TPA: zincin-like metallopeptidase domain-containing protein, partial [Sphingobacteriaceae bacterium]
NLYSTLLHELVHWSGHPARLNREFGKRFGDHAYAAEELLAELGAAFLCADLEISREPRKDHADYIASWLKALKSDKYLITAAANNASKAVAFLNSLQPA